MQKNPNWNVNTEFNRVVGRGINSPYSLKSAKERLRKLRERAHRYKQTRQKIPRIIFDGMREGLQVINQKKDLKELILKAEVDSDLEDTEDDNGKWKGFTILQKKESFI